MNDNHKDILTAILVGLTLCAGLLAYIEIWEMPNGFFDVIHTMNSNARNQAIDNGGKKIQTIRGKT